MKPDRNYFDKMPLPNNYERELLTILIEECAEVQQRATKMLRFGRDEIQRGQLDTNAARLSFEIGDLLAMVDLATDSGLVLSDAVAAGKTRKYSQLAKFMVNTPLQSQEASDAR